MLPRSCGRSSVAGAKGHSASEGGCWPSLHGSRHGGVRPDTGWMRLHLYFKKIKSCFSNWDLQATASWVSPPCEFGIAAWEAEAGAGAGAGAEWEQGQGGLFLEKPRTTPFVNFSPALVLLYFHCLPNYPPSSESAGPGHIHPGLTKV